MSSIGVFGGTFDPPHIGHLALAEWARERLGLERVLFVPTGRPPHKRRADLSPARDRLAMTRIAVRGNPAFRVSTLELESDGPSYTVDTVRKLAARVAGRRLVLLIGADSLDDFATWHEPETILELATLAVAARPGAGRTGRSGVGRRAKVLWLGNPGIDVSSSLVRARARAGHSVRYLVPDGVAAYIARRGLYRAPRAMRRAAATALAPARAR
jgi:nicotinate-nucleotide adenylyltransferase